jgi:hypothetical protein
MKPITAPIAAEVRQDQESEAAIVQRVKEAVSTCNWTIGEGASDWTARYARGRTDEDFGEAVGLSRDKVNQCRRVWERFGKCDTYRKLSWSHHYVALTWEDADRCLAWACENYASVSEMKSWRSVQHGGNLGLGTVTDPLDGDGPVVWVEATDDDDPFGWIDPDSYPFGEGEGEEGGTETDGTDSEEEQPPRPPRNGREASGGKKVKTPAELRAEQKAKAVKTLEAGSRAIGDLHELDPAPQDKAMITALRKMIEALKSRG